MSFLLFFAIWHNKRFPGVSRTNYYFQGVFSPENARLNFKHFPGFSEHWRTLVKAISARISKQASTNHGRQRQRKRYFKIIPTYKSCKMHSTSSGSKLLRKAVEVEEAFTIITARSRQNLGFDGDSRGFERNVAKRKLNCKPLFCGVRIVVALYLKVQRSLVYWVCS